MLLNILLRYFSEAKCLRFHQDLFLNCVCVVCINLPLFQGLRVISAEKWGFIAGLVHHNQEVYFPPVFFFFRNIGSLDLCVAWSVFYKCEIGFWSPKSLHL